MHSIDQSIEIDRPVSMVYSQWTHFEAFPEFMPGVTEVRQVDDKHLHWKAMLGGKDVEWDAEITEQVPDSRIAWKATDGKGNAGVVSFHRLDANRTKIMLQLAWESDGMVEALGAMLQQDDRAVKGDLDRFKEFIENRGHETGAWRGEVERPA